MNKGGFSFWYILAVIAVVLALAGWAWHALAWLRKEPWETAPLGQGQIEKVRLEDRQRFTIDRVRFYSSETNGPRFFLALKPKTDKPVDEVFILSHGWFDRPEYLLTELKVDDAYDRLLAAGAIRPALLVLPDVRFPDHFRRNRRKFPFPQYLALVAEEVAGAVSRTYDIPPAREKWSVGGFSFGGYLSLDIGRRYPGRFGAVSSVSGFAEDDWKFWGENAGSPGPVDARERGLQTVVVPGPAPRIFLACGADDRMYSRMQAIHERFTKMGVPHEWSTGPGGHTWKYWSSVLEPMLRFDLGS